MRDENVQDLYRLSPTQAGLLFHTLAAGEAAPYFEQFVVGYEAVLDGDVLERSWRRVVERHAVLRTSFFWEDVEEPVQVVHRKVELPFERLDWSGLDSVERERRLQELLAAERARGFDLTRPPLLRLAFIRWGEGSCRIVWSFHHLLLDGWSVGLVLQEVAALYEAEALGRPAALQPRRPFRDYIAWLRRQDPAAAEAYWRRTLAGFTAPTALAGDRAPGRPPGEEGAYAEEEVILDEERTAALQAFARAQRLTLFTAVEGAWAYALARHAGTEDVVFGNTVSGRPPSLQGAEGMIGCFINTLPVRARVEGAAGLADWLRQLQADQVELRRFEHSSLLDVRRWSEVPPGPPLFDAILVFENLTSVERSESWQGYQRTNFPLALVAWPGRRLALRAGYYEGRFDAATVRRLLEHVAAALDAMAAGASRLADLPPAPGGDLERLAGWNRTEEPALLPERPLHALVAEQVARTPEAVAVSCEGASLTYRELEARAGALARRLLALGAGPGSRVGVALERSLELPVALLATLKAGAAYVPLDPAYPAERLAAMAEDAFGGERPIVLGREETASALEGESGGDPGVPVSPDDLAYVLFTSGSTGRPKGAMNTHRGIVNRLLWMQSAYPLDASDRVLQKTPYSFDVSVWELFWPLVAGARLVLARPGGHQDPEYLVRLMAAEGITTVHFVPSMLQVFLEEEGAGSLRGLRRVIASGEALAPALVDRFFARMPPGVELHNLYGPTEAAVDVSAWACAPGAASVPIGRPIANTALHVLDRDLRPLPVGVPGELHIGGAQVARGYVGRPDLTAERFVPDPTARGSRLYRTGDLARWRGDGALEYLGRLDHQVKIRGVRIEPGEIEAALRRHPGVREAAVLPREAGDETSLAAFVVCAATDLPAGELRAFLRERLPEAMVPAAFVAVPSLPLTANGKLDRAALLRLAPDGPAVEAAAYLAPASELERTIAEVWREVLGVERVGLRDNFFDLGGHSLKLMAAHSRLRRSLPREVSIVEMFQYPTVEALARYAGRGVDGEDGVETARARAAEAGVSPTSTSGFAVIGLAGRFPGARDLAAFWDNLRRGVESIETFSDEELLAAGVDPGRLAAPGYVRRGSPLEGADLFDADFFGFSPREAEVLDPQQRLFLECAWEALENAGHDPRGCRVPVGVYAGAQMSTYMFNVLSHPEIAEAVGVVALQTALDKDFVATRVSYELDLRGPSLAVQTACSSSLVAVHLACQALRLGECDMALAGGVTVRVPQRAGYPYQEAGIQSPDGHCRAFDAEARGTVFGSGLAVVVLKRLADALRDGDAIHAVVKGTALNNDGSLKVGYTAPGVEGQAQVVAAAQAAAGVSPDTVTYVEAHGTGTPLGDPIEVAALSRAFRNGTERTGFCALGSVKSNVGHLDAAAGIAGFVKTVLALEHRQIPPSLHFQAPNPKIDFAASPFRVATELADWPAGETPRRAGVSSFGIGGTNAHVVLEEAPPPEPSGPSRPRQLLLLSARTPAALEEATDRLAAFLEENPSVVLADAAYTLRVGRHPFEHRRALVGADGVEAASALRRREPGRVLTRRADAPRRPVAFLFPGQGAQHVDMGRGLWETEPVFRRELDAAAEALRPRLGVDLREVLYPAPERREAAARELTATRIAQPALFVVEHALARLWLSWGIAPRALLGHSVGEYVAACLAGVFSPADALALVADRGELMQSLPPGAMLSVDLPEVELAPLLAEIPGLALAAVNSPAHAVLSGPADSIAAAEERLAARGAACRRLHTSHAFHSGAMEPILQPFAERVARVERRPPSIPFLSNLTGGWITAEEAVDPGYWARHLRGTVRFGAGLASLLADSQGDGVALLEVGPGRTLSELSRASAPLAIASMRHPREAEPDDAVLLQALGRLWLAGAEVDWDGFHAGERRRRVPLPTYPFQRKRFWIEAVRPAAAPRPEAGSVEAPALEEPAMPEMTAHHGRPELDSPWEAPRDEAERRLVAVWEEILGIGGLGVHDDFFELGGHSLLATRVISRVREAFGREMALEDLFDAPTPARFAARLGAATAAEDGAAPPIVPVPRDGELPLSFAQQRLFFLDVLAHGDVAYNLPLGVRLRGGLDAGALERALAALVRRHEVLRTTFRLAGGRASQVVSPEVPEELRTLPAVDLGGLPPAAAEAEARRAAVEAASRRLDLFRGPVLRPILLRLGADDHVLVLVLHHIAGDGWSWGVLLREVVELYAAFAAGSEPRLPELPVQYADFAVWQRRWLDGDVLDRQLAYWRRQLAALPATEVPTDRPRPPARAGRGAVEPVEISRGLTDALIRLGREEESTLFMVLLSAFAVLLHHYKGEDDLVVGADVANRNRGETEGLIGLFVNQLVLRSDLSGDPTVRETLRRVRRTTLAAYAHQDAPFDRVVEVLNPARDMSRTPLFQVKLVLQNTPLDARALPGLAVSLFDFHNQTAKFDLLLNLTEGPSGISGALEYDADLYEPATAQRLLAGYGAVLAAAAERPDARLGEIEEALRAADRREAERRARERQESKTRTIERVKRKAIAVQF
jgi:amino acid adenylation domain-containing protein